MIYRLINLWITSRYIYLCNHALSVMDYTSVPLPKVLADRIRAIAAENGYRSVSEFVLESTRTHLEEVENRRQNPK